MGYGDFSPATRGGRWFVIFFIPISLTFVGGAFSNISHNLGKRSKKDAVQEMERYFQFHDQLASAAHTLRVQTLRTKVNRLTEENEKLKEELARRYGKEEEEEKPLLAHDEEKVEEGERDVPRTGPEGEPKGETGEEGGSKNERSKEPPLPSVLVKPSARTSQGSLHLAPLGKPGNLAP